MCYTHTYGPSKKSTKWGQALTLLAEAAKELRYAADTGADHEVYMTGPRSVAMDIDRFLKAVPSARETEANSERFKRLQRYGGVVTYDRGYGCKEVQLTLWWLDHGGGPISHENWVESFDRSSCSDVEKKI